MPRASRSSEDGNRPVELRGARELCYLLGVTQTRVGQLKKDGIVRPTARDKYDIFQAVPAYCEMLRRGRAAGATGTPGGIEDSKARKAKAEAEMAEREAAKQADELLDAGGVEAVWLELLTRFRSRLLGLKVKLAPLVSVEDEVAACEAIIADHIDSILAELSGADFADSTVDTVEEIERTAVAAIDDGDPSTDTEDEPPEVDEAMFGDGVETSAETDGEPVGGQEQDDLAGG